MITHECILTTFTGLTQTTKRIPCTRGQWGTDLFRANAEGYERAIFVSHDAYDTIVTSKRRGGHLLATLHPIDAK